MRKKIEYYALVVFLWLFKFLPSNYVYAITRFLGRAFFKIEKRRSLLTKKNLKLAFGDKLSSEEIEELAKKSYDSLAITLAEIIMMLNGKIEPNDLIKNKEEALKKFKNYINSAKNGVVIITAHFSNWEVAAQFFPMNGYKMMGIGREGNNKLIEKKITTPFRQRYGNVNIYKHRAMIGVIKHLKKSGIVGMLIDQKSSGKSSIKVKFFDSWADTTSTIATLKLKYDPLILPVFMPRDSDGKYMPLVLEPVEYRADEVEDEKEKIRLMTQKYNNIIEGVVREYPEQWFWMHNRWRIG